MRLTALTLLALAALAATAAAVWQLPCAAAESEGTEAKADVYQDWPFDDAEAKRRQEETITSTFDLLIQATEIDHPRDGKQLNDFLVTQQSAECQYPGSPFSTKIFFPGKMHGDVSDFTVGEDLFGRGDVFIPRR